jgi:tetratricopeptide (TPR) repeat protein
MDMLEAYRINGTLEALEAWIPKDVEKVKLALDDFLNKHDLDKRALFLLARCHLLCDETEKAKDTLQVLVRSHPGHISAKVELAKILFGQGDTTAAIKLLREATNADPVYHDNWRLLGEYLEHDEQHQESKEALAQYDMIKAFNAVLQQAQQELNNGNFEMADKMCRQLLQKVPNEIRTLRLLARIARHFHYFEVSTSILTDCVKSRPDDVALGFELAGSLLANRRFQQALEQCNRLIELAPENIDTYELKAEVLFNLGQYEETIAIYRELTEVHEMSELCLVPLGKVLKTVGNTEEAISCFHKATKSELTRGQAFWELANLKTYRFTDEEIASMQSLEMADDTPAMDKVLIRFALGKAMEDQKQFAESFEHYQAANRGYLEIRPVQYASRTASLKSFFNAEYFSGKNEKGNTTNAPIFVVGLPRSGSTLVEQILTCHSMVDATTELNEITSIARELSMSNSPGGAQYPQSMAGLEANEIQGLAQRYLDFVQPMRQQAAHFVDKQPDNFHHIGLIKTLFPNAKIIDIRRDPMASGWSLYSQFFAESFRFSYDLATIGQYYNDYIELMDHWHAVLPGQILTVSYEELVSDLSTAVESMLQYCGLEFEPACLDFHKNRRAVATPSSEQVRQALYVKAIDHWKNYDEFLTPLKQVIGR